MLKFSSVVPEKLLSYDVILPHARKAAGKMQTSYQALTNQSQSIGRVQASPEAPRPTNIPPILFLHGLLGHRKNNRTAARFLANNLNTPCIIPDLRNHGTSFHARPLNYRAMSDDLTTLLSHLRSQIDFESKGLIVIGHSMGGKAAMVHALRFPDLVRGVVSVDNVPYANPETSYAEFEKFHIYLRQLHHMVNTGGGYTSVKQVADALLKFVEPRRKVVSFLTNNLYKSPTTGKVASLVPLELINDYVEDIIEFKLQNTGDMDETPAFQGPLLLMRANYSPFVGPDLHTHAIERYFPNYSVQDVDSGHWIVQDCRNEFVSGVTKWALAKFQR